MDITILTTLPTKDRVQTASYKNFSNADAAWSVLTRFPIAAYIEMNVPENSSLDIVLLKNIQGYTAEDEYEDMLRDELDVIVEKKALKIKYSVISSAPVGKNDPHEAVCWEIISKIKDEANIVADMTYSPKDVTAVMFSVLAFAEDNLGAVVQDVLYGSAPADKNGQHARAVLQDVRPVYSLLRLTSAIKCNSSEDAREMLRAFVFKE